MLLSLFFTAIVVVILTIGLAWPLAARLTLSPAEKLLASTALSLIATYIVGFATYVLGGRTGLWWLLPGIAVGNLFFERRALRTALADTEARAIAIGQLLVMAWCAGWLGFVASYSGGGWIGDWFGHWQRALFFLERGSPHILFNGFDPLPSRPPLVNVVAAVFLRIGDVGFAQYQLITTLLGSLAFMPTALLARRFGGTAAIALCGVFLMLNPLFVQNATFAWTKLPAAFFTLTALFFFLRTHDANPPTSAGTLCGAALAAAILAHYSAVPYAILLAGAWSAAGWRHQRETGWWRATGWAVLTGILVLITWFGWALATYGVSGTLFTNTTVTEKAPTFGAQLEAIAFNLRDTLVPHFLRDVDFSPFAQRSVSGWWRDWFFQLYQVNLLFAFGSVAWLAMLFVLVRRWRESAHATRVFWAVFIGGTILLGVAVHSARDAWGLAHICLQPVVLIGLAFLAANWPNLGVGWRRALLAGATIDFTTGMVLHFGVQNGAIDRWLTERSELDTLFSYSVFAQMNLRAKLQNNWGFFADSMSPYSGLIVIALASIGVVAIARAARGSSAPAPAGSETLSEKSALRLTLCAAALGAIACLWKAWCEFPMYGWNELRLAPAFAWRHGVNPYPPLGGGPLSTWIYGPVGMLVNFPATWAASVEGAVHVASLINAITVLAPLALIFFCSNELRARGPAAVWLALSLGVLLVPAPNLSLQVADHSAIAFGILSCWCLARNSSTSGRAIAAAAALCTLAIWAKQTTAFLVPAHLAYLLITRQRRSALRYFIGLVVLNAFALASCAYAFGFSNFWLNTVTIPNRLPWASDIAERLALHTWPLLLQIGLPLIGLGVLSRKKPWSRLELESSRLGLSAALAFIAMIPIGIASLVKYGGNTNVLHSWDYLLPAALLAWLARDHLGPASRWRLLGVTAIALALRWTDLTSLPVRAVTSHYERAAQLTAAFPGASWFPNNPLITFYADGKFWHTHDGIVTRDLAGIGLRKADFRRHLPANLHIIVYPVGVVFPVALQLLPEYKHTLIAAPWSVHSVAPLNSDAH